MHRYDKDTLVQLRTRLEKRLAALIQASFLPQLQPFLLVDLRQGWFACHLVVPSVGGDWRRNIIALDVYVGAEKTNKDRFRLGFIQKRKRWLPADAETLERGERDKFKTSVMAQLESAFPEDAQTYLGGLFVTLQGSVKEHYERVVLLVDNEAQHRVISEVIPACFEGKHQHAAWQQPEIRYGWAKHDELQYGFALFTVQHLLSGAHAHAYLVNALDKERPAVRQYQWDGRRMRMETKTGNAHLDLSTAAVIAYVTPDSGLRSTAHVLVFQDIDTLQDEATARRVLYDCLRPRSQDEDADQWIAALRQQIAEISQALEKARQLRKRADAVLGRLPSLPGLNGRP